MTQYGSAQVLDLFGFFWILAGYVSTAYLIHIHMGYVFGMYPRAERRIRAAQGFYLIADLSLVFKTFITF